jgi:transcription elongation factor Elf1
MERDLHELLSLLREAALKGSPDDPSYRVARAMECGFCHIETRLLDWNESRAVFGCPSCGRCEAVEIPSPR